MGLLARFKKKEDNFDNLPYLPDDPALPPLPPHAQRTAPNVGARMPLKPLPMAMDIGNLPPLPKMSSEENMDLPPMPTLPTIPEAPALPPMPRLPDISQTQELPLMSRLPDMPPTQEIPDNPHALDMPSLEDNQPKDLPAPIHLPKAAEMPKELSAPVMPDMTNRSAKVFVQLNKYKDIVSTVNKMENRINELQGAISKMRDIRVKERELIDSWNGLLTEAKSRIEDVNKKLPRVDEY